MKKFLLSTMAIYLVFVFLFSFIGCSSKVKNNPKDTAFEQSIDERLYSIAHPKDSTVSLSSNPYDYIKGTDGNRDYQYIVSKGEKSLNYMLKKLANNDNNGLEEYIMAIACSEILKENSASKNWASGREWYNNNIQAKK